MNATQLNAMQADVTSAIDAVLGDPARAMEFATIEDYLEISILLPRWPDRKRARTQNLLIERTVRMWDNARVHYEQCSEAWELMRAQAGL